MSACLPDIKTHHEQGKIFSTFHGLPIQGSSAEEHLKDLEGNFDCNHLFLGKVREKVRHILGTKVREHLQKHMQPRPLPLQPPTELLTVRATPPTPAFTIQIGDVAELDTFQRELALALSNDIGQSENFKMMKSHQLNDNLAETLGQKLGFAAYRGISTLQTKGKPLLKRDIFEQIRVSKLVDGFFSSELQKNKISIEGTLVPPTASSQPSATTQNSQLLLLSLANKLKLPNSASTQENVQQFKNPNQTSTLTQPSASSTPPEINVQDINLPIKSGCFCFS